MTTHIERFVGLFLVATIGLGPVPCLAAAAVQRQDKAVRQQAHASKTQKHCEYDYVIVGLGTAGAPLARYLSDDFNNSVLVLEAGSNLSTDPFVLTSAFNPGFATAFPLVTHDSKYAETWFVSDEKNFPTVYAFEQYAAGRMWGGSSAHNAQQAVRGTPDVYDQWDAAVGGSSVWSYNNLLPYMKGMENYAVPAGNTPVDTAQRGTTGPLLQMANTQLQPAGTVAYYGNMAAQTGGANHIADGADYNAVAGGHVLPNDGQNLGAYAVQFYSTHETVPADRKRSFSVPAWISDVVTAEGHGIDGRDLTIASNATAHRVHFDKNLKARGVHYIQNGVAKFVKAKKQVILCAGCPGSSTILQRSGIGDPIVLAQAGVECLVQNPNVGANLSQHYGVVCETTLPAGGLAATAQVFADASQTAYSADFPAGKRQFQLFCRRTNPFNITPAVSGVLGLTPSSATAEIMCWNLRPRSKGTAYILDNDPFSRPQLVYNQYSDGGLGVGLGPTDLNASAAMIEIVKKAAAANGLNVLVPAPSVPVTVDYIKAHLSIPVTTPWHPTGTCRMGTSRTTGVVDKNLKVFGTKNLMVVDNSVMPVITSGNTAYPAYVLGSVAASLLGATVPTN